MSPLHPRNTCAPYGKSNSDWSRTRLVDWAPFPPVVASPKTSWGHNGLLPKVAMSGASMTAASAAGIAAEIDGIAASGSTRFVSGCHRWFAKFEDTSSAVAKGPI